MIPDYAGFAEAVKQRIEMLHTLAPGSIGGRFAFSLVSADENGFLFHCQTEDWMVNAAGTLHGGMCAAMVDQAMGFAVYAMKVGEGAAPSIQLDMAFHRPVQPGQGVLVRVWATNLSKTLMNLRAEAYLEAFPEKLCFSGSGIYYVTKR